MRSKKKIQRRHQPVRGDDSKPVVMESESDDDDDDDEADQEWVRAQWASLVQRQRAREEHVRRLILSRNLLQPLVSRLLTDLILLLFFWGGGLG